MDKIIPAFEVSLLDPTISDVCLEMAEMGIDSLLEDGVFKSVPLVGVLVGIGKTAQNIQDRNLLKQTVHFINSFNEKKLSNEKIDKYRQKLKSNSKYAEEELGRVIILLNTNVDVKKSETLAKFYRAYVNDEIDWSTFCELSDITSRMFVSDFDLLVKIYRREVTETSQCQFYKADRLISSGLLDSATKSMAIGSTSGGHTVRYIQTNILGNIFCTIGFRK